MRHEPVDVLRWSEVEVAAAGTKDPLEVINLAAQALDQEWTKHGGMPVVIRLRISGTSAAHDTFRAYPEHWAAQFRAIAQEYGQGQLWIEKILFNTQPAVDTGDWSGDEAIATIIKELRMLATDPSQVAGLLDDLNQLKQKLPPDLLLGPDSADPTEPQTMDSILSEARDLIEARLLRGGMQP